MMTTRSCEKTTDSSRPTAALRSPAALVLLCLALVGSWATTGCSRPASLEQIRELQAKGQYAETLEPLRERLKSTPDDLETHYLYGVALSRTGSNRVAVWSLRKAAEDEKWKLPATLELAAAESRSQNWDSAITAASEVIDAEPDNLEARMLRGDAYASEGKKLDLALADYDYVLAKEPTSVQALNSRASTLLLLNRIDEASEAIDQLEALVDKNPMDDANRAHLCAAQAVLRRERGEVEEAEKRLEECLEQFPTFAIVVDSAIDLYDSSGKPERSTAILEKALEVAPLSVSYRRTLALRMEASGHSDRALEVLKDGLKTDNREILSAVWTDIANYHLHKDEVPEALEAFEQALALNEDPPELAILTHADLLARVGRYDDALKVAKNLKNDAYVGLIEARIALDQGDPKRALARLDQVFPTWPNNAGARYYAARAAEQMGDFVRAIEEYRQSIRSAPDQTEAALRLANLYLAAGAHEDAWNTAAQYINDHLDDPEGARVIVGAASRDRKASLRGLMAQVQGTPLWPAAVATRAGQMAQWDGPKAALAWIDKTAGPEIDWTSPAIAELLRKRVLLMLEAGQAKEAEKVTAAAIAAHPESAPLLEVEAARLEASGADAQVVRSAFEAAIARDEKNALALEGLGRVLDRAGDVAGAIAFYDRATKVHPESPTAARRAAQLSAEAGKADEAERRWNELLKERPWDAEAARALTDIRVARKQTDAVTRDYAERAVMFGGGKPAEEVLVRVYELRGEHERAEVVAKAFKEGKRLPPRDPVATAPASKPGNASATPQQKS
jgi:tetratricopeptide (TPR) repeat protein